LKPNDDYSGRTVPITYKRYILYSYSTCIVTEYFKHGIYSPFFPLQNAVCFINLTYLVPVLFTFNIEDVQPATGRRELRFEKDCYWANLNCLQQKFPIHGDMITFVTWILNFYSLPVTICTTSLTFNNCTFCPHSIYVFCIYLRTNSDLCQLLHKLIGFYNRDEKCLQRGTDWGHV